MEQSGLGTVWPCIARLQTWPGSCKSRGTVLSNIYSAQFFDDQRGGSLRSAAIILPYLMQIFEPKSLLDVGCGQGTWLKNAMSLGMHDCFGVDGAWARPVLSVPQEVFGACDLSAPFDFGRTFDLAISMEVGEHLAAECADTYVGSITRHADAIVFSAAAPFQGGVHHVNEQWPSYWAKKFAQRGYRCFDFLRWRLWNDRRIAIWYRQNLLIFANHGNHDLIRRLEAREGEAGPIDVIHPEIWHAVMNSKSLRLQRLVSPALRSFWALLRKRV